MPNLNTSILSAVPFLLPPLPEQKAIAYVLGSLDDKIELNRRMNETLEGMAQALFKSWFVDFDPVLDNALARRQSHPRRPRRARRSPPPGPRRWQRQSRGRQSLPRRLPIYRRTRLDSGGLESEIAWNLS